MFFVNQKSQAKHTIVVLILLVFITATVFAINGNLSTNSTGSIIENKTQNISRSETNETKVENYTEINISIPPEKGVPTENVTNITEVRSENYTNITQEVNVTQPKLNETETNITIYEPEIEVEIVPIQKAVRGESVVLKAIVRNIGQIHTHILLEWLIPNSFKASDTSFQCSLGINESCTHSINLSIPISASLGTKEVKVRVSYG